MAPGLVTPEKARARQAADERDVAHDRLPHRAREDRLPDAEARGRCCAASCRRRRARATCAWTRSRARARSARWPRKLGRRYLLMDSSPEAVAVMQRAAWPERVVARGPGRVNLIGEHTDYNGGLALPFAIDRGVTVTAEPLGGDRVEARRARPRRARRVRARRRPSARDGWRAFVRGTVAELRAAGFDARARAGWTIEGDVPRGSGLSSSAALEAALCLALLGVAGEPEPDRVELAKLCSRVENDWVGAETGLLDQLASLCRRGRARAADRLPHARRRAAPLDLGDWQLVTARLRRRPLARRRRLQRAPRRVPRGLRGARHRRRCATRRRTVDALAGAAASAASATCSPRTRASTRWSRALRRRRPRDASARLLDASHASLRDDYEASVPEVEATVERAQGRRRRRRPDGRRRLRRLGARAAARRAAGGVGSPGRRALSAVAAASTPPPRRLAWLLASASSSPERARERPDHEAGAPKTSMPEPGVEVDVDARRLVDLGLGLVEPEDGQQHAAEQRTRRR